MTPKTRIAEVEEPRVDDSAPILGRNLTRIAVIDDSFDQPSRTLFGGTELEDFWTSVEDQGLIGELQEFLGDPLESPDEFTDAHISLLYRGRNRLGALEAPYVATLASELDIKHGGLDSFVADLREKLGLEVRTFGTRDEPEPGWADVIFIDYYLGEHPDQGAVAAAVHVVKRIMDQCGPDRAKPLVVLMSSHADVSHNAEEFRAKTSVVGGMFFFVPKADLKNRVKLRWNLDLLAAAAPIGTRMQRFIDSIENKISLVSERFMADIRRLSLDDYVFIQRLSLQKEGHPLGDYLLWLFSTYLDHLLFEEELGASRDAVDRIRFDGWMPSHALPSPQLTQMYYDATFDDTVGPLRPHPRGQEGSAVEVRDSEEGKMPDVLPAAVLDEPTAATVNEILHAGPQIREVETMPRLGDMFLNRQRNEVRLIITPDCDLAFAPEEGEKRSWDPERGVLLVPGVLQALSESPDKKLLRTELVQHDGRAYRIIWNLKYARIMPVGTLASLETEGYERIARMRLPFALEIQHRFAASLTRVGLPVRPPFYRPVEVRVYERDFVPVDIKPTEAAFLIDMPDESHCVLTTGLVRALHARLSTIAERMADAPVEAPGEGASEKEKGRARGERNRIERLRKACDDSDKWRRLSWPFPLASNSTLTFEEALISVKHGAVADGSPWPSNKTELLVSLLEGTEEQAPTVPAPEDRQKAKEQAAPGHESEALSGHGNSS